MKISRAILLALCFTFLLPAGWSLAEGGKELQKEVQTTLKRWKKVPETQAQGAARELLVLYQEVEADESLPDSTRNLLLRNLRMKLDALSIQIAESELAQRKAAKPESVKRTESAKRPESVKRPEKAQLGQQVAPGAVGNSVNEEAGEQLIEVIQNTIHPESWEQNGGNGTIQFWTPNGHLIIRQTDENHQKIQNLLSQLRRAGG